MAFMFVFDPADSLSDFELIMDHLGLAGVFISLPSASTEAAELRSTGQPRACPELAEGAAVPTAESSEAETGVNIS